MNGFWKGFAKVTIATVASAFLLSGCWGNDDATPNPEPATPPIAASPAPSTATGTPEITPAETKETETVGPISQKPKEPTSQESKLTLPPEVKNTMVSVNPDTPVSNTNPIMIPLETEDTIYTNPVEPPMIVSQTFEN